MNILDLIFGPKLPKIFTQYPIGSKIRFIKGEFAASKYEGIVVSHSYICDTVDCIGIDINISPTHWYKNYPVTDSSDILLID